jgi:uncharacterized protein YnzC (UPF0291/DUF896 family)
MKVAAATHHAPVNQPETTTQVEPTPEAVVVNEPAKAEPPVAEPTPQPVVESFDVNKYLSEKTGFNEQELLTTLEKYKGINIEELSSKASKADELEAKYKDVEPANEFVSELNKLLKSGASPEQIQEFYQLSQTDLESLSPKEVEILRLQKEKGLSKEDAIFKVERLLDEDRLDEETVKLNNIELKTRFKENVNYLKQYRKELSVTEAQKQAQANEQRHTEYVQSVEAIVPKVTQELKSVKILDIAGDKENPMPFEYVLPDEFRKEADKVLKNTIISNGYDINNAEQMERAKEVVLKIAIATDPERFAKSVLKHYQSAVAEKAAAEGATRVQPTDGRRAVVVGTGVQHADRPRVVFNSARK